MAVVTLSNGTRVEMNGSELIAYMAEMRKQAGTLRQAPAFVQGKQAKPVVKTGKQAPSYNEKLAKFGWTVVDKQTGDISFKPAATFIVKSAEDVRPYVVKMAKAVKGNMLSAEIESAEVYNTVKNGMTCYFCTMKKDGKTPNAVSLVVSVRKNDASKHPEVKEGVYMRIYKPLEKKGEFFRINKDGSKGEPIITLKAQKENEPEADEMDDIGLDM